MPSTTVHIPPEILQKIDSAAGRRGMSRNKFVLAACEMALREDAGVWPDGFFDGDLNQEDARLVREATLDMEHAIMGARRNRGAPLL